MSATVHEPRLGVGIHSEVGQLREAIVHRPGRELDRLTPANAPGLLFDDVMWADRARDEHDVFSELLSDRGVRVHHFATLLEEALATPDGRAFAVEKVCADERFGPALAADLRALFADTGQTVVIVGGSSGIGLATALQARSAGAGLIITGRNKERLERAGNEVGALTTATVDLADPVALDGFFTGRPARIDHVLVTGGGPTYSPIVDLDFAEALRVLDEHLLGSLRIARACAARVRAGGSLTLITGTHARRPSVGLSIAAIAAAAVPVIAANIAVELAPMRANVIAAGFVDTPLSARLLGDQLDRLVDLAKSATEGPMGSSTQTAAVRRLDHG